MSGEKAGIVEAIGQSLESIGITEDMVTGCIFVVLGLVMFLLWFFVIRHIKNGLGTALPLATTDELVASLTADQRKAARVQADEWLLAAQAPGGPEQADRAFQKLKAALDEPGAMGVQQDVPVGVRCIVTDDYYVDREDPKKFIEKLFDNPSSDSRIPIRHEGGESLYAEVRSEQAELESARKLLGSMGFVYTNGVWQRWECHGNA